MAETVTLGGGGIDGYFGKNPDWSKIKVKTGRTIWSSYDDNTLQAWLVEDTNSGGVELAGGNYANPIQVAGNELPEIAGYFVDGFEFKNPNQVGIDASGNSWRYIGTSPLPYTVTAGTDPAASSDYEKVFESTASNVTTSNGGSVQDFINENLTPFETVADMRAYDYSSIDSGSRIEWQGYYAQSDGGSNWGVLKKGDSTVLADDGGSVFVIVNDTTNGVWIEANLKGKSISVLKWGMKGDDAESSSAINTIQKDRLLAYCSSSNVGIIKLPEGIFRINTPWVPSALDQSLKGSSSLDSRIVASDTFVGEAVFHVDNFILRTKLKNIFLSGNNLTDCVRITDGGLGHIEDVQLKFGNAGLRLIKGNGWRGFNVYAESCVDAYVVEPSATNDTNDTFMRGLRAFNCSGWGLDVKESSSAGQGHMHSSWEVSIENCGNGVRVSKGRNVEYTMYVEGIGGTYWDLDHTVGNDYTCKNPDGEETGLFGEFNVSKGTDYKGVELLTDKGVDIERVRSVSGGNINLIGRVKNYILTNTAGAVRTLTLTQMANERVGYRMNLYKDGSTSGFTIAAPAGYTLIGDSAVSFGVNVAASAEAIKISSTEIFLKVNNS